MPPVLQAISILSFTRRPLLPAINMPIWESGSSLKKDRIGYQRNWHLHVVIYADKKGSLITAPGLRHFQALGKRLHNVEKRRCLPIRDTVQLTEPSEHLDGIGT